MIWLLGAAIYLAIGCFVWALCIAAWRADDDVERMIRKMTEERDGI